MIGHHDENVINTMSATTPSQRLVSLYHDVISFGEAYSTWFEILAYITGGDVVRLEWSGFSLREPHDGVLGKVLHVYLVITMTVILDSQMTCKMRESGEA